MTYQKISLRLSLIVACMFLVVGCSQYQTYQAGSAKKQLKESSLASDSHVLKTTVKPVDLSSKHDRSKIKAFFYKCKHSLLLWPGVTWTAKSRKIIEEAFLDASECSFSKTYHLYGFMIYNLDTETKINNKTSDAACLLDQSIEALDSEELEDNLKATLGDFFKKEKQNDLFKCKFPWGSVFIFKKSLPYKGNFNIVLLRPPKIACYHLYDRKKNSYNNTDDQGIYVCSGHPYK
ncbi:MULTISPECIES: hypothetical protein [Candidatus Cardinium]|uniref:hypothetical protein n=1 Tax=Candidatus Cardinium TaxID=273135 RepID=UPI001FAA7132|nr:MULTISPECIES: hypothetical protein [Cardinium]